MELVRDYAPLLIGGLFTVLWYLLRQKDDAQAEQIKDLYAKHEADEKQLIELRLQITGHHYVKEELDAKFDKLEAAFRQEFRALGDRIACSINKRPQERRDDIHAHGV